VNGTWTLIASVFPIVLALGIAFGPTRRPTMAAAWAAALPALAVAISARNGKPIEIGWLLFGVEVDAPDDLARALLLPVSLLWLAAGWFAETYIARSSHRVSFWLFFLLTCGGNVGALLARDVATFYVGYAVMTFSAYGLILHDRTEAARRAGRVYIAMALGGEVALLAALWMIVGERVDLPISEAPLAAARAARPDLVLGLLFVGFGVKAGVVPLHMWLPLAHPVAPAPASAVLSGALIKAGLFGWLRFLPLGFVARPSWGTALIVVGLVTIAYAAVVGALQREPKTVLAYSSSSQMGYMLLPLGIGLAVPGAAAAAVAASLLFAQQHVLVKGALFLGTAVAAESVEPRTRRLVTGGLFVLALAIAGGPFTSGALAKLAVKGITTSVPNGSLLGAALAIGSIGSTLLMARFLVSVVALPRSELADASHPARGVVAPWLLLVGAALVQPVFAWSRGFPAAMLLQPNSVWSASWPVAIGAFLALAAGVAVVCGATIPAVAPGDLVVPIERVATLARDSALPRGRHPWTDVSPGRRLAGRVAADSLRKLEDGEARMTGFRTLGLLVLLLALASATAMQCGSARGTASAPERRAP